MARLRKPRTCAVAGGSLDLSWFLIEMLIGGGRGEGGGGGWGLGESFLLDVVNNKHVRNAHVF